MRAGPRSRPLSLTGQQFRPGTYALPSKHGIQQQHELTLARSHPADSGPRSGEPSSKVVRAASSQGRSKRRITARRIRRSAVKPRKSGAVFEQGDRDQVCRSGDGFEDAERVMCRPRKGPRGKVRQPYRFMSTNFKALSLRSGPLPEVTFERDPDVLEQASGRGPCKEDEDDGGYCLQPGVECALKWHDPAKEQHIQNQLSSISAPIRIPSESSESEVEGDDDSEDGAVDIWNESDDACHTASDDEELGDASTVDFSELERATQDITAGARVRRNHKQFPQDQKLNPLLSSQLSDLKHDLWRGNVPKTPNDFRMMLQARRRYSELQNQALK